MRAQFKWPVPSSRCVTLAGAPAHSYHVIYYFTQIIIMLIEQNKCRTYLVMSSKVPKNKGKVIFLILYSPENNYNLNEVYF